MVSASSARSGTCGPRPEWLASAPGRAGGAARAVWPRGRPARFILAGLLLNADRLPSAVAVARGVDWAALRRATDNSLLDVVAGIKGEEMQAASLPPQLS